MSALGYKRFFILCRSNQREVRDHEEIENIFQLNKTIEFKQRISV